MKQSRKAAKPKHQKEVIPPVKPPTDKSKKLTLFQQDLAVIIFFVVVVIILHSPLFFNQRLYDGGDSHEALVKTNMINKFYQETGEIPRWNPYPEAGIPNVFFLPKPVFSPDFYLSKLGDVIGISIVYLLIGVIGMYFLLRYLKFNLFIAASVALLFILAPYYRSLIIVGQYMPTKFEAVMIIPWIVLAFLAYMDKMKLVHAALFSLAISIQMLTQHYQVIFYTGLLVLAIGVYPLIRMLREKHFKEFILKTSTVVLAALFSLVLVAYPLFVSKQFNDASLRSTWGIDLSKPQAAIKKGSGVDIDFIRQWSPGAGELKDLLLPAATGGTNKEMYKGEAAAAISGYELPAYWGKMTFSFSYLYFGIAVLLALAGLIAFRRNPLVISLGIAGLIFTLWSLGTTLEGFYMFFYDYLPFFKNFRTPPTSMTVVYFILAMLSAYGLQFIFSPATTHDPKQRKKVLLTLGGFFIIGLLLYLGGDGARFTKIGENFEANYAALLKEARRELYFRDLGRFFIMLVIFSGIVAGYTFRMIRERVALILAGVLLVVDVSLVNERYTNELLTGPEVQARYFPAKPITDFFKTDTEVYRVFPVTDRGRDLSAVVPIIGDHDLQVLTTVYEINTNNLYRNIDSLVNINWNVLKIFGVKYFVADRELYNPQLTPRFSDPVNKDFVYQFNGFHSFGHFVNGDTVVPNGYERLQMLNNAVFDPANIAILEKEPGIPLQAPDSSFSKVIRFTPNECEFEVYTDKQALFVVPIPYVAKGWTILIDGKESNNVFVTNHAVQSIAVPPGNHKILARFNKSMYTTGFWISAISYLLLYALLGYLWYRDRRRKIATGN